MNFLVQIHYMLIEEAEKSIECDRSDWIVELTKKKKKMKNEKYYVIELIKKKKRNERFLSIESQSRYIFDVI